MSFFLLESEETRHSNAKNIMGRVICKHKDIQIVYQNQRGNFKNLKS